MQGGIIPVHVKRELQEAPPFAATLVGHFLIRLTARALLTNQIRMREESGP
jgi:hypothetical protein